MPKSFIIILFVSSFLFAQDSLSIDTVSEVSDVGINLNDSEASDVEINLNDKIIYLQDSLFNLSQLRATDLYDQLLFIQDSLIYYKKLLKRQSSNFLSEGTQTYNEKKMIQVKNKTKKFQAKYDSLYQDFRNRYPLYSRTLFSERLQPQLQKVGKQQVKRTDEKQVKFKAIGTFQLLTGIALLACSIADISKTDRLYNQTVEAYKKMKIPVPERPKSPLHAGLIILSTTTIISGCITISF